MSDDSEEDISFELDSRNVHRTPGQKRKRINRDDESPPRRIVHRLEKTPMPVQTVRITDGEEWEEWKKRELAKREWHAYLQSKWDLTESKLPKKSDTEHIPDRKVHRAIYKKAHDDICEQVEAINELNFNVGKGKAINIQCNGKDLSQKQSKKFAAQVEKALKQAGKPTMEEMLLDDMDEEERREEEEFAKRFAKKGAHARETMAGIKEYELGRGFDPWEEWCDLNADEPDDSVVENDKNYKKWLKMKIEENKVSPDYNAYQLELRNVEKDGIKKGKSLKSMVKGVQNFYRNLRGPK